MSRSQHLDRLSKAQFFVALLVVAVSPFCGFQYNSNEVSYSFDKCNISRICLFLVSPKTATMIACPPTAATAAPKAPKVRAAASTPPAIDDITAISLTSDLQEAIAGKGYEQYVSEFGDRKPSGGNCADFGALPETHLPAAAKHGHALPSRIRYCQLRQRCERLGIAALTMRAYCDKSRLKGQKGSRFQVVLTCSAFTVRKTGRALGQTERWVLKSAQKRLRSRVRGKGGKAGKMAWEGKEGRVAGVDEEGAEEEEEEEEEGEGEGSGSSGGGSSGSKPGSKRKRDE